MMTGLLVGTFAFFWLHTALWFYREYKDRKAAHGEAARQARRRAAERCSGKQHPALQPDLAHRPPDVRAEPDDADAHRHAAVLSRTRLGAGHHRTPRRTARRRPHPPRRRRDLRGIFFWHLVYMLFQLGRNWRTFKLFGPQFADSDLAGPGKDIIAMFKWFFGKGPRPVFDRWTYWEKFDYWAPFWGVTIIGVSGLMHVVARLLRPRSCRAGSSTWRRSSTARKRSSRWCSCSRCTSSTTTSGRTSSRSTS